MSVTLTGIQMISNLSTIGPASPNVAEDWALIGRCS